MTSPPTCGSCLGSSLPLCRQSVWTSPPPYAPSLSFCQPGSAAGISSPVSKNTNLDPISLSFVFKNTHNLFKYNFTDINESDVQFSGGVASLQVASNIDVIISDDAGDKIRRGDALCPLSGHKHA